jgi:hypothetical protein
MLRIIAESATRDPDGKYHNWPIRGISVSIRSDTSFTGRTHFAAVGNSTVNPEMLSISLTPESNPNGRRFSKFSIALLYTFAMTVLLSASQEHQCQELNQMARPRSVFMVGMRIVEWFIVFVFWSVFELAFSDDVAKAWAHGSLLGFLFPGVITIGFVWFVIRGIRGEFAHLILVTQGECAVGKVILQEWTGRKSKRSEISYEFKDALGNRHHSTGDDMTIKYRVDASVIIFYLLSDPTRNVATCCTGWRVRANDGLIFEP